MNNIIYKQFSPATKDATYDLDIYGEDPGQFFLSEEDIEDSDKDEEDQYIFKKWNKILKEHRATATANVPLFEEEDSYSNDDSDSSSNENWQRLLMMEEMFKMKIDVDDNEPRPGSSSAP